MQLTNEQIRKLIDDEHIVEEFCEWEKCTVDLDCGANPACSRHVGKHLVPCFMNIKLPDGGYGGTAAHPGFVIGLPIDTLRELGFTAEEIYIDGLGCEPATHCNAAGNCDCVGCIVQGPEKHSSRYSAQELADAVNADEYETEEDADANEWLAEETDDDRQATAEDFSDWYFARRPNEPRVVCESCAQMADETIAEHEQIAAEQE